MVPVADQETDEIVLTPEDIEAIEEGLRSAREDPIHTLDEAFEIARARSQEWMKIAGIHPR
ncbi:hypothetical protein BH11ARM2_BH11ARM2_26120 [soil metagenome]